MVEAGDFAEWLRGAEASLRTGKEGMVVPCGSCTACCHASLFIPIGPDETRALQRIPQELRFQEPLMPKGHQLMGYGLETGRCPMFVEQQCSIYEDRPQACRNFDCRMLAATGVNIEEAYSEGVRQRVKDWEFTYASEESREEHELLRETAAFLMDKREKFPVARVPRHPGRLAGMAVRLRSLYQRVRGGEEAEVVRVLAEAMED